MRTLHTVHEFQEEASSAIFTKQQAVAVTLRLLELEMLDPENTDEETQLFADALKKAEFRYLDMTKTATDSILDSLNVARFTASDIVRAINDILFDVR